MTRLTCRPLLPFPFFPSQCVWVWFLLLSRSLVPTSSQEFQNDVIHLHAKDMVQWLRDRGGFMSEKIEIRRRTPGDVTTPSGLFAGKDIEVDEVIFRVPSELYIKVADSDVTDDYYKDLCQLSHRLMEEIEIYRTSPTSSEFAPYIRYLEETQSPGQLPATYSSEGKAVLRKIQGISSGGQLQFQE